MEEKFEKYIKEMLEYIADSISEDNESTRNKVIRILKICIMKFGLTNTELLLTPIREVFFLFFFINFLLGIIKSLMEKKKRSNYYFWRFS